jgi:phage terminase large subunit
MPDPARAPAAPYDWKNPDTAAVIRRRVENLKRIRAHPDKLPQLRSFYRANIAQFIFDFGITVDPRVRPAIRPFVLFPKQVELVRWISQRIENNEPGVVVKSRDVGASWIAMAVACSLCLFNRNFMVGIVSAKEANLDRSGDPDSLLYKARMFISHLPAEFRGGFDVQKHSADLRILIPDTGSSITGSTGDNAGRGGRKSIVFVDESAHIERPQLLDAALASVTNVRIDMSSVNGSANSFAEKARTGRIPRFDFGWRDDPRKDDAWYEKKCQELDPVVLAQEIDCNFSASAEGLLIPSAWVQASVDAHLKLRINVTGGKYAALDVADQGADRNAFAVRRGILLEHISSWSGKGSDIYATTIKAFSLCDQLGCDGFYFDSDGLGAGVLGDSRRANEDRAPLGLPPIHAAPFRGSAGVHNPNSEMVPGRRNEDYFANLKAQSWMALRKRFEATHRALQGLPFQADDLISISSECGELSALLLELGQPTYHLNSVGRIIVDKVPDGARSPNLGDAVMICFSPATRLRELWIKLAGL